MENGTTGRERECDECIFFDTCGVAGDTCEHFYSDGMDDELLARDEGKCKIEYLKEWEVYIKDF